MPDRRTFRATAKRCNQCLFSSAKIVDDDRRLAVLAECEATGSHFVCHKFSITEGAAGACCRGFYDQDPHATVVMRLAAMLDLVEFVALPDPDPFAPEA